MRLSLEAGDDRVVLDLRRGGRLASLIAGGAERLLPAPPAASSDPDLYWGCFLMAPWAGRVRDAVIDVGSQTVRLPARDGPHALHGLVLDQPVDVVEQARAHAVSRRELDWVLGGRVSQRVTLEAGRLTLEAEVNADRRTMPAWLGWHPWFARPSGGAMAVRLVADQVLRTTADKLPTGEVDNVEGDTDLRDGPLLGGRRLDHAYPRVRWPAEVVWPDLRLTIDASQEATTAVVHTPPHAVCVEPQTAWPDAATLAGRGVSGTGVRWLEPGETLRAATTWTW